MKLVKMPVERLIACRRITVAPPVPRCGYQASVRDYRWQWRINAADNGAMAHGGDIFDLVETRNVGGA